MITQEIIDQYTVTIGIECHVQLRTRTKLFAAVSNDARDVEPNTLVSHICFGLPGALPVLNEEAVNLAMRAAFALGSRPQKFSKFDRKHYFYPDLPKGYQITQFDQPIILGGAITIDVNGEAKKIGIARAHLEEDAGKSTHPEGKDYSLVDLNRAGTPLLEIVSEPEIHTAAEAKAYARELYLRMKYAGVSDANLFYGNMRFDINISVSKTDELGTRTETKNINSFRAVEKVVDYELRRQIEELEKGNSIVQETRGWDDTKQKTFSQRTKEDSHDYRYFPDPDIPPIVLNDDQIKEVEKTMPVMPDEWRGRLMQLQIPHAQIETLLDTEVEFENVSFLPLIEQYFDNQDLVKFLINWQINTFIPLMREGTFKLYDAKSLQLECELYELVKAQKLSSTNAKALFEELVRTEILPENIETYASNKGYIQVSDESEIADIVAQVIATNEKAVQDVKNGEMKAIGFLVGQVMKQSKGKANPALAQEIIKRQTGAYGES